MNKCKYNSPQIVCVELDNEISLVLQSDEPPSEPGTSNTLESFKNDPFKTNQA